MRQLGGGKEAWLRAIVGEGGTLRRLSEVGENCLSADVLVYGSGTVYHFCVYSYIY